jgi:hypothetical protein
MSAGGKLSGAERVVALLRPQDLAVIDPRPDTTAAVTTSQKFTVLVVPSSILNRPNESIDVVGLAEILAHELAHTMPFNWSASAMIDLCGVNYHNIGTVGLAHGHRITIDSQVVRGAQYRQEDRRALMGGDRLVGAWITQCTYRNLVEQLVSPPDPELILVRGRLARGGNRIIGELLPSFQFMGLPDLKASSGGDYAIVLRDAQGAQLARFPFTAQWRSTAHHGQERNVLALDYAVPDLPGTARIDLVGPGNVLFDSRHYSAHAPTVSITTPAAGSNLVVPANRTVEVRWTGADADGDSLLYSAFYSADGGQTWTDFVVDRTDPVFRVRVNKVGNDHRVRVIATDGARSGEAEVRFAVAELGATPVAIDIRPGATQNTIDLRWPGAVPVAILSSPTFDAATANAHTVTLAGAPLAYRLGHPLAYLLDINRDGRRDLVVHVEIAGLQLTPTDRVAVLEVQTNDGDWIRGTDSVRILAGATAGDVNQAAGLPNLAGTEVADITALGLVRAGPRPTDAGPRDRPIRATPRIGSRWRARQRPGQSPRPPSHGPVPPRPGPPGTTPTRRVTRQAWPRRLHHQDRQRPHLGRRRRRPASRPRHWR